jgi:cellulose synthase operon protein C
MRVVCPHCNSAYQLDDARVPDRGANVRCTRCRQTFPVRKAPAAGEPLSVPLPGAAPAGASGIPLPAPFAAAAVTPPAGIPLPPPVSPFGAPSSGAPSAEAFAPSPFDAPPASAPASPFDAAPPASPAASPFEAVAAPPPSPFDAAPASGAASPFGAGPFAATESPFAAEGGAAAVADLPPFGASSSPPPPLPPAAAPAPAAPPPLSFGEVDLGSDIPDHPLPTPAEVPGPFTAEPTPAAEADPFAAATRVPPPPLPAASPASPASAADAAELEMLFGEAPRPAQPAPAPAAAEAGADAKAGGYRVRRRSGKVFGPFDEAQIVEMLSKGELLGNEDVTTDGTTYAPIGAVAAFGAALRKAAAAEPAPARPVAPAPFGDRMAGIQVNAAPARRELPPWAKWAALGAALLLLVAAGVGAGFTRYGFFFSRTIRRGSPAALAGVLGQVRASLARGDFPAERSALEQAARAVALDGRSPEAGMLHAMAVAALGLDHGAPPEAVAQARKAADQLERDEKGEVPALAARLAVGLAAKPVAATLAQEAALEAASAKRKPDAEVLALLARAALARGDAAKAAAWSVKLEALEQGPRGPLAAARAALLRKAPGEAKAALEKAVARAPGLPAALVELAALDEQAGALPQAEARLAPLVAEAARPKLAPVELARALTLLASVAGHDPARAAEADQLLEQAVTADPQLTAARVQLALQRIHRGDPAAAVAATDPVAKEAAEQPELAAARIRALALAGRALDAAQLADQALARSPGRIELLTGKAFALGAAGKPADAKAIYADVISRDPGAVEARVALARFALSAGQLDRAGELLAAAVEKGPRDPAALAATGDLLLAKGDRAGAEAAYRKALELDRAHAPAEMGLAKVALARGDAAAARAAITSALSHEPRNPDILVEHATLLWRAGELAPAEAEFTAALDVAPRHALALARLGAVLLSKGDTDAAVRRLTAASNEAPDLAEARLWLGRALLARSETPGAVTQLRRAVELSPSEEDWLALGSAYEKGSSLPEALDAYRSASAVAPQSAGPQERIGLLLSQNGRCDQAVPAFQKAIALAPGLSRLRVAQAECTARLGKHEEAVKLFEALLKADPKAVPAYYLLARSLHESKGLGAALPWYERAAREEPANAMPHYYLGYAYKERGQKAKAVAEFKKFLEIRPDAPEKKDIEAEIEDLGGR